MYHMKGYVEKFTSWLRRPYKENMFGHLVSFWEVSWTEKIFNTFSFVVCVMRVYHKYITSKFLAEFWSDIFVINKETLY